MLVMAAEPPDSNVGVALASERHRHHQAAFDWSLPDEITARFCRMTQNSFLRLMTVVEFRQEHLDQRAGGGGLP